MPLAVEPVKEPTLAERRAELVARLEVLGSIAQRDWAEWERVNRELSAIERMAVLVQGRGQYLRLAETAKD